MPTTAVVITFDDDYSCSAAVQETLSMDELQRMVGRNAEFDVSKSKIAKGKVVGLDGDISSDKVVRCPSRPRTKFDVADNGQLKISQKY